MPERGSAAYPARVNADLATSSPVTSPSLAELRVARHQQQLVQRWLQPLGSVVVIGYVIYSFRTQPSPGLAGHRLAISIALGGFLLGGLGSTRTRFGALAMHVPFLVLLVISSAALIWLQPAGPGTLGLFIAAVLAARRLPGQLRLVASVAVFAAFALTTVLTGGSQTGASLVTLGALGAFYLMTYLANRLSNATGQAELLLTELERTRAAEARAAGLAERQRLAREMHDVLAHSLSGLMFQLEAARMLAAEGSGDARLTAALDQAHHLGKAGLDEARQAIGMLRDDDLPGPERLAGLAARFEQDRGVPCRLTVSGPARELSSEARLAVYRVAQEALTNITRHAARPERVEMCLAYEQASTRLVIEDRGAPVPARAGAMGAGEDGRAAGSGTGSPETDNRAPASRFAAGREPDGADAGRAGRMGGGYGLTGMRVRAELLGGTLTAGVTGTGYRVELEVPA